MTKLSNRLADLAERVKEAASTIAAAERTTIEAAYDAGLLLIEAKDQCAHGEWTPFLDRAGMKPRQAQRLMQIAGAGLGKRHVTLLGGVKAALEYVTKLKLPEKGDILFVSRTGEEDDQGVCAWIAHSAVHEGCFDVHSLKSDGEAYRTTKPAKGETIRCPDGFFNGVWCTLELLCDIPHDERDFTYIPADVINGIDDCAFLSTLPEPDGENWPPVATAPLPLSYELAVEAVRICENSLTRESYAAMERALNVCAVKSRHWPDDKRMLPSWARIAGDKISDRIGRLETIARSLWGSVPA